MVGTVAERTVRVAIAVIARQQPFQGVDQVVIGAGTGLDTGGEGSSLAERRSADGERT